MNEFLVIAILGVVGALWHVLRGIVAQNPISHWVSPGQVVLDRLLGVQFDARGQYRIDSVHNLIVAAATGSIVGIILMAVSPGYFDPIFQILKSGM